MTDGLIEVGRCCGTVMSVGKTQVMKISVQPFPVQIVLDQKRLENEEYFNSLGIIITYYVRCTREIKSSIAMEKKGVQHKKYS
jgi:hypothetical protein